MSDQFYRDFEERFYAPREVIRSLREQYLPFVLPLAVTYTGDATFDIGCGRGEWLELMTEAGFSPYGVDLDEGMLKSCQELGLPAEKGDAIPFLAGLPDESQVVVSAFHVVEHLSFEQLNSVVKEALRVLKPGGLLIMETPNPENFFVAANNFYLDPTHQRPIPLPLLSFLAEFHGFARNKVLRLQESKDLAEKDSPTLSDVLAGASPDYAIIAQKTAHAETMECFDEVFKQDFGLSLNTLIDRFDNRIQRIEGRLQQADERAQQADERAQQADERAQRTEALAQQADTMARQADTMARQAEAALLCIYNSRSWRITRPLRLAGDAIRWFVRGSRAWLTFTPMSRPRRGARQLIIGFKSFISVHPRLKALALRWLAPFPALKARLRAVGCQTRSTGQSWPCEGPEQLSPRARQIYYDLKLAIEKHKQESQ